jgi:hypothetical protein
MLPLLAGAALGLKFGVPAAIAGGALIGGLTKRKDEDFLGAAAMGGLSAFGGANLATGLANAGSLGIVPSAPAAAKADPSLLGKDFLSKPSVTPFMDRATSTAGQFSVPDNLSFMDGSASQFSVPKNPLSMDRDPTFGSRVADAGRGLKGLLTEGGWDDFRQGLNPEGDKVTNFGAATAIGVPALGVASGLGAFDVKQPKEEEEEDEYKRLGGLYLYGPNARDSGARFAGGGLAELTRETRGSAGRYGYGLGRLDDLASENAIAKAQVGQYYEGGEVAESAPMLQKGGFVVSTDVINIAGGQNNEKGQEIFMQKYGAIPIKGPGDGYSDSIPTTIDGVQEARVADGEVYIPPHMVEAHGGAKKFYDLMDRVRKQATGSTKQVKQVTV